MLNDAEVATLAQYGAHAHSNFSGGGVTALSTVMSALIKGVWYRIVSTI